MQTVVLFCNMLFTINAQCGEAGPSEALIKHLIQIESSGNLWAVGDKEKDHKAYGPLQVRQLVCDDLNKVYRTRYRAEQCLGNLTLSVTIFKKYVTLWGNRKNMGRNPTDEDYARIWNGGPNGWKREATKKYAAKVRRVMGESRLRMPLAIN